MNLRYLLPLCFLVLIGLGRGQDVTLLGSSIVELNGLTFADGNDTRFGNRINGGTHQQQSLSSFRGYQYVVFYNANRHVCVGRRKLPAGSWDVIELTDYDFRANNSHNVIALGICHKDGTIHLAFDHHATDLNYRVSVLGAASDPEAVSWNADLFGPVNDELGAVGKLTMVTYPRFFSAPNGNLMLYYRSGGSGSGDGLIHEYDGEEHDWTTGMGRFISRSGRYDGVLSSNSGSRNPYINGISYGGDRLHISWGWRESSGGAQFNHDLCYAYSDDHGRTWRNTNGAVVARSGTSAITVNSPGVRVAEIPENSGLTNQFTHFAYPDGRCHVLLRHNDPVTGENRYQHHWRNEGGVWSREALPFGGSRPKLAGDDDGALFLVYTGGGTVRIARGSPIAAMTSWSWDVIRIENHSNAGGEGQFDLDRWREDRVLSVYDQERADSIPDYGNGTPVDGMPTPLHVRDYQVSSLAILPQPLNRASEMLTNVTLSWAAGLNASLHRVFLGTDADSVAGATTSSPEYRGTRNEASFSPAGLDGGVTYYWRIDEVSGGAVAIPGMVWSFETAPLGGVMMSLADDASVRDNGSVVDLDNGATLVGSGGSGSRVDRCTVFVFQLPNYGEVSEPFGEATLQFGYQSKQGTLKNCDLYGLGRRGSPEVLERDYYGQTMSADPSDASLLQRSILTNSSELGLIEGSGESLRDYLNTQYASGAGAGMFVFLRLNTAGPKEGIDRATITMSEGGDEVPRVAYTLGFPLTTQQEWRMANFGSFSDEGGGAGSADPDADGESNFYEFVTGQNPLVGTRAPTSIGLDDSGIFFQYQRGSVALQSGVSFIVEWSDTLEEDSWSSVGITSGAVQPNGESQLVTVSIPAGEDGRRFVRLRVLE